MKKNKNRYIFVHRTIVLFVLVFAIISQLFSTMVNELRFGEYALPNREKKRGA